MLPKMRTTLTIEDDLAGLLRRKARELDKPFKVVVNSALRKGLADEMEGARHTVVVRPHDFGDSRGLDADRLNQLADELEVEDYLGKVARKCMLCSTDADFGRFPGLRWINPLG